MRWLAKRVLRGQVLELEDGTAVFDPDGVSGPGYLLQTEDRQRLESHKAKVGWVVVAFFAILFGPPKGILDAWLTGLTGDTHSAMLLGVWLLLCALALFAWLAQIGKRRFLVGLQQRDPVVCEDDLKRLFAALESAGRFSPYLTFFAGPTIGLFLGMMMNLTLIWVSGQ